MDDDYKKIAGAFLLGGVIGAVVALLYAPKSGRETRK
ncbi:MAG: YtxH domain-containing protein, partial [Nitrospirota bacterium]